MAGSFRDQIVESDAQRLAREQLRYAAAWQQMRGDRFSSGVATLAMALTTWGMIAVFDLPGWFAVPVAAFCLFLLVASRWTNRCPRCGLRAFDRLRALRAQACRECHVPFGYLPTAEDLDRDEPGPG